MQKQAPSIARIVIAAGFTLSCFGLMLFLWIAFGGPVPLSPESYRFTAYFPEATTLAVESDVRIGGVSVGKVKKIDPAPPDVRLQGRDVAEVEIEIRPEYAPISKDAEAIMRQKTLLGETFIELTSGTEPGADSGATAQVALGDAAEPVPGAAPAEALPEGEALGVGQTREATQIDEIFNALDDETREAFQRWQASASVAIQDRGLDFNDALGNLAPFITDASDTLEILAGQEESLRNIVRDVGITFEALSERRQELTESIRGSKNTFEGLAAEDEALADTIQILPTFQRESRATLERLDSFRVEADPLIRDLIPVARQLDPTLDDVRRLAPDLKDLFIDLDDLQRVSLRGLPALRDFLDGLAPVIEELDPFLADFNPIVRYLEYQKTTVADFLAGPAVALSGAAEGLPSDPAPRHMLRQVSVLGNESLSIHPNRLSTNRGHGYVDDGVLNNFFSASRGIIPSFDCKNTDYSPGVGGDETDEQEIYGDITHSDVNSGNPAPTIFPTHFAPCWVQPDFISPFGESRSPQIYTDP